MGGLFGQYKMMPKKIKTMAETLAHGTHLRVLSESYPMNTNMTGFRCFFKKTLCSCALDKSSLSIGRVKIYPDVPNHIYAPYVNVAKKTKNIGSLYIFKYNHLYLERITVHTENIIMLPLIW